MTDVEPSTAVGEGEERPGPETGWETCWERGKNHTWKAWSMAGTLGEDISRLTSPQRPPGFSFEISTFQISTRFCLFAASSLGTNLWRDLSAVASHKAKKGREERSCIFFSAPNLQTKTIHLGIRPGPLCILFDREPKASVTN